MKLLDTLCPSSSPEEVEKTILDTMLVKSWPDGLTAILLLFCDCLLERRQKQKMLGVLFACLKKATKKLRSFQNAWCIVCLPEEGNQKNNHLFIAKHIPLQTEARKLSFSAAQFLSF